MKKNIIILGPQGCGKGTQAELLEKKFGWKHLSMGDLLRDASTKKTPIGKKIHAILNKGELVPEKITNDLAKQAIKKYKNGIIFDGYPRTESQAKFLLKNTKIDLVIDIEISEKETIKRLGSRRVCTSNHKIFKVKEITKKDMLECKKSGGTIIHREDDKPAAIKKRLEVYHKSTEPVIRLLKNEGISVRKIDGAQKEDKVLKDIEIQLYL